jgi:hypothetical protein
MKRNGRIVSLFSLLSCLTAVLPGIAKSQASNTVQRQVEVRISPKTKAVEAGWPLEVRVEIWNVGHEQLFIEKTIHEFGSFRSPLSLHLDLGPPLKPGRGGMGAGDCADDPKETFASRLERRWIPLPPGHFYGTVVRMDAGFFPQLNTPGRWRLRGEYGSKGDMSSSICVLNPIPLDPEQIARLPYKAWQGKEETNTVWIEVLRPGSAKKTP